jgi:hypothetical protein
LSSDRSAVVDQRSTYASTAAGHRLQLPATQVSPANHIAPPHYSQITWAVAIGAVFFNDFTDWISVLGLLIVSLPAG